MSIYDAAVDSWMMHNPGETFGNFNVATAVGNVIQKILTRAILLLLSINAVYSHLTDMCFQIRTFWAVE